MFLCICGRTAAKSAAPPSSSDLTMTWLEARESHRESNNQTEPRSSYAVCLSKTSDTTRLEIKRKAERATDTQPLREASVKAWQSCDGCYGCKTSGNH